MSALLIGISVELGNGDTCDTGAEQPECSDPKSNAAFIDIFSVAFTFLCCHFNFRVAFSGII